MAALVVQGNFEFVAGGAQIIQRIDHVGLGGSRVFDENAAGSHDSEGEGKE